MEICENDKKCCRMFFEDLGTSSFKLEKMRKYFAGKWENMLQRNEKARKYVGECKSGKLSRIWGPFSVKSRPVGGYNCPPRGRRWYWQTVQRKILANSSKKEASSIVLGIEHTCWSYILVGFLGRSLINIAAYTWHYGNQSKTIWLIFPWRGGTDFATFAFTKALSWSPKTLFLAPFGPFFVLFWDKVTNWAVLAS